MKAISRDEYFQRLKDYGRQRCALLTCMTCSDAAGRWETWEEDPRKAVEREINWECRWRRDDRGTLLRDELRALAALVAAHQEEFRALMARQAWNEMKASRAAPSPRDGPKRL